MSEKLATLAAGCFWCTEAIFKRVKGVSSIISGYSGGDMENPDYERVSSGTTGHAEAIQIEFDPEIISYESLLKIFFRFHDPTTINRQGTDVGTQYRSVIFYHDDDQKKVAEKVIKNLIDSRVYPDPIITKIVPYKNFFKAEDYHQDYFAKNPSAGYCQLIIDPKVQELLKDFKDYLKDGYK